MGTAAGVTNFCGLYANVHGEIRQVVHGVADELLARIDRLGGLNAPHLIFGKTKAQAYDTAAYKIAADDLLLGKGVAILFHALACGIVAGEDAAIAALLIETKSGRCAVRGRVFIDCSGDGDRRPGRGRHSSSATPPATCSIQPPCFASTASTRPRPARRGRRFRA